MDEPTRRTLGLLDSHGQQLFRLLYRLTLCHDAAEDLLQELMCALLKSEACCAAEDPAAYASRMAMNLAFHWRQRRLRESAPETRNGTAAESPLQAILRQEEYEHALRQLSDLSELTRECLVLRYIQGKSPDEIARLLDKTQAQIRAICSKGLSEIRKRMGAERADGTRV